MDSEDFECQYCGATGEIAHSEEDSINFCPFCGEELYTSDDEDEDWGEDDEE